jgi:hypothetical protein
MPKRIGCAMRNGMSAARRVAIPHHYERGLQTKAGNPVEGTELRQQTFETVIIERYRRRERAH